MIHRAKKREDTGRNWKSKPTCEVSANSSKQQNAYIEHLTSQIPYYVLEMQNGWSQLLVCQESHIQNNEKDMEEEEINIT